MRSLHQHGGSIQVSLWICAKYFDGKYTDISLGEVSILSMSYNITISAWLYPLKKKRLGVCVNNLVFDLCISFLFPAVWVRALAWEHCIVTLYCDIVLWHCIVTLYCDTLLSQSLSSLGYINRYWRISLLVILGVVLWWTNILSRGVVEILLVASC